jgi:hypothetical protein
MIPLPCGFKQKHRRKNDLATSDNSSGIGGLVGFTAKLYMTDRWFVFAGHGCFAVAISMTVAPTLQMSALKSWPICWTTRAASMLISNFPSFFGRDYIHYYLLGPSMERIRGLNVNFLLNCRLWRSKAAVLSSQSPLTWQCLAHSPRHSLLELNI